MWDAFALSLSSSFTFVMASLPTSHSVSPQTGRKMLGNAPIRILKVQMLHLGTFLMEQSSNWSISLRTRSLRWPRWSSTVIPMAQQPHRAAPNRRQIWRRSLLVANVARPSALNPTSTSTSIGCTRNPAVQCPVSEIWVLRFPHSRTCRCLSHLVSKLSSQLLPHHSWTLR